VKTVRFVCVGNTFRSVLAESMFNARPPEGWHAESAGIVPGQATSPAAIELLKEIGLGRPERAPRPITKERVDRADLIVAFGCLDRIPHGRSQALSDWAVPGGMGKTPEERSAIREEIRRRVGELAGRLRATDGPTRRRGREEDR